MLAIGRALLTNPKLLVMDEPSEGLAPTIVEGLVQTIKDLAAEGMGLLVVEQNLGVATSLAERQLIMVTGADRGGDDRGGADRRSRGAAALPRRRAARRRGVGAGVALPGVGAGSASTSTAALRGGRGAAAALTRAQRHGARRSRVRPTSTSVATFNVRRAALASTRRDVAVAAALRAPPQCRSSRRPRKHAAPEPTPPDRLTIRRIRSLPSGRQTLSKRDEE